MISLYVKWNCELIIHKNWCNSKLFCMILICVCKIMLLFVSECHVISFNKILHNYNYYPASIYRLHRRQSVNSFIIIYDLFRSRSRWLASLAWKGWLASHGWHRRLPAAGIVASSEQIVNWEYIGRKLTMCRLPKVPPPSALGLKQDRIESEPAVHRVHRICTESVLSIRSWFKFWFVSRIVIKDIMGSRPCYDSALWSLDKCLATLISIIIYLPERWWDRSASTQCSICRGWGVGG